MKNINIYSTGSCDNQTKIGHFSSSLEYKGHFKYLHGELNNTTANRCIIQGIIEALKIIKEPCNINVITATLLGISQWEKKRKGVNADLISDLHTSALEKSCILSFEVRENEGYQVKKLATKNQ